MDKAERVLIKTNTGIYQRAGQLVRIVKEESKPKKTSSNDSVRRDSSSLVITEADPIHLSEILGKEAIWTRFDERKKEYIVKDCPIIVPKTLIARRMGAACINGNYSSANYTPRWIHS